MVVVTVGLCLMLLGASPAPDRARAAGCAKPMTVIFAANYSTQIPTRHSCWRAVLRTSGSSDCETDPAHGLWAINDVSADPGSRTTDGMKIQHCQAAHPGQAGILYFAYNGSWGLDHEPAGVNVVYRLLELYHGANQTLGARAPARWMARRGHYGAIVNLTGTASDTATARAVGRICRVSVLHYIGLYAGSGVRKRWSLERRRLVFAALDRCMT